jgi:hypothetical protein
MGHASYWLAQLSATDERAHRASLLVSVASFLARSGWITGLLGFRGLASGANAVTVEHQELSGITHDSCRASSVVAARLVRHFGMSAGFCSAV